MSTSAPAARGDPVPEANLARNPEGSRARGAGRGTRADERRGLPVPRGSPGDAGSTVEAAHGAPPIGT